MRSFDQAHRDYQRIARAIRYIEEHMHAQPSLEDIAASVELSVYHFDRLFKRWAGVTPKRFLQFLTLEYSKKLLEESRTVLETSYAVGLSGPGRLHDHFVTLEAVTPGQYKSRGRGLDIAYGLHDTRFGRCLVGVTERGICSFHFVGEADVAPLVEQLERTWKEANLYEDTAATRPVIAEIMHQTQDEPERPVHLHVKGTNFQVQVWRALLRIPSGHALAYEDVAALTGHPRGVRAISSAIAQNPIAYLIPCHRVFRKTGEVGGYLWGRTRKRAMVGWEAAQRDVEERRRVTTTPQHG